MWRTVKKILAIGIPTIWLIIFVPKLLPSLNKVAVESSSQPVMSYNYSVLADSEPMEMESIPRRAEPMEMKSIPMRVESREMESIPMRAEPGLFATIWKPMKLFIAEAKEVLSTLALLFQVGKLYRDRRKRKKK